MRSPLNFESHRIRRPDTDPGYGLRIQTGFALAEVCGLTSTPVSSCRCCVLLTDLRRRTEYLVRVQALTVNGSGPATQWLSVQTFANDLDGTAHFCLTC